MKKLTFVITAMAIIFLGISSARAQLAIDLESGIVSTGYNDVRIPGDKGTLFSLKDDLAPDTELFYRVRLNYILGTRHNLSLLYAPLETTSKGSFTKEVNFEGQTFAAQTDVTGTYKFNSYRLTYRYDIVKNPGLEFGLGFTAKIRDAKIALSSQGKTAEKTNVGFVPIINFRLKWNINEHLGLLLDGDALAAPQGRAEDVLLAVTYKLSDSFSVRGGYRILEGGADNDEVYNFALLHYAALGITYTLK